MIFDENVDLRGCTVRLRYMKPGESLTIPADASRRVCSGYVAYYFVGTHDRAFQNTLDSGMNESYSDIVEVLHRPEAETQKPSNKEPTVKTTTAYEAGVMHLVAYTADGVTGYTVEATALGSLCSMDIDELRQLRDVIDAALSDAEVKA